VSGATEAGSRPAPANPRDEVATRLWSALGVLLLLAAAGAALMSGASAVEPQATLVGPNVPVDPGATDPVDISAHNSPTLARNPLLSDNLAVTSRIDSPRFSCALNVSFDGGKRWSQPSIPVPRGEEPKCYAPDVAFGADGTMYLSFVTLEGRGNVPHAAWLVRSEDGGRTLSAPVRMLGPLAFQVRLVADPVVPRRLYLSWLQADAVGLFRFIHPGNPVMFSRSDDGGDNWSAPARVSSPARARVVAPSLALGPAGRIYALYVDLGGDRLDYAGAHEGRGGPAYAGRFSLVLARSRDGGRTWAESVVDDRVVPTERFVVFLPRFPSLAVDRRTGRVHVGYEDARFGDPDVVVWTLRAGAARWSRPTRVNDTPMHDRTAQYLPQLALAPGGRLDVLYYDRRDDPRDVRNEVSLQSSLDGGRTFGPRLRVSDHSFDSRIGFGSERGLPDLGSRLGLVSSDSQAIAAWSDTRAGSAASNKQDIAQAAVRFSERPTVARGVRDALHYGSVALAALGVLVLLSVIGTRRRHGRAVQAPA